MARNELTKLKAEITAEVGAHPDKYKDAGKWLDEFCSDKEWRRRQKGALKAAEDRYAEEPTDGRASCISDLKERVKRRRKISLQMCLSDALHYWLKRYGGYESVDAKDGRCILLISLLLLEPDSETVAGKLTKFAQRPWMTDDEIDGRAWAGMPLRLGGYADRWEKLIRSALEQQNIKPQKKDGQSNGGKVDLPNEKSSETGQDITPSKRRGLIAWLKNHPHSYGLTGGVIFWVLFLVVGLFKPQWRQWCWGVACLAFLGLVLSLLGGRSR